MAETKIELTERLRREGRWEEASRLKENTRQECRAKGLGRKESIETAWEAMERAYPPLPVAEGPADPAAETTPSGASAATGDGAGRNGQDDDLLDLGEILGDESMPDMSRDAGWVYQRLLDRNVTPQDAPSAGAWALLVWARKDKRKFFESVVPKLLIGRSSDDEANVRRERQSISEIEEMLAKVQQNTARRLAQDLAANVRSAVKTRIQNILTLWTEQFALALSPQAAENLQLRVGQLVQNCLDAPASREQ